MRKLLLVGSNSIHVYNYYKLIEDYFDEIMVITEEDNALYSYPNHFSINFSLKKPLQIRKSIKFITQKIESFKPTIIHIHQASTYSYFTLKAAENYSIPTVITAWGSDILYTPKLSMLHKKLVEFNLRHANYFTSDSLFMAAEMERMAGKNIDLTIANFGINIVSDKREKENIIYSNRLHKKFYRIDKIINAFAQFENKRKDENWKLVIAGSGEETDNLKALANDLKLTDKVEFVGWLDASKNSEYYNRAKIFVSIPESDGTALSLLEAMYAGCIPVLANLPANTEWVIDGINGVIVTSLDENFIEKALHLDYKKSVGLNREIIEQKGTKEANKKIFTGLYNRMINE